MLGARPSGPHSKPGWKIEHNNGGSALGNSIPIKHLSCHRKFDPPTDSPDEGNEMTLACVAPDDLSIIIFCRTLCKMARDEGDIRIVTFGAVGLFEKELADLQSEHVQISMDRFVAPKRDIQYFWQLYSRFRRGGFDAARRERFEQTHRGVELRKEDGIVLEGGEPLLPSTNA